MSRLDAAEPVAVRVGDCLCANTPHDGQDGHDDGDIVYLDPQLSLEGGLAANAALATNGESAALERELGLAYVLGGVSAWNFLDDLGRPIPVTPENIRRALPWGKGGRLVAEVANTTYFGEVIGPLVERAQQLSAAGVTAISTSHRRKPKAGTPRRHASSSSGTSALSSAT